MVDYADGLELGFGDGAAGVVVFALVALLLLVSYRGLLDGWVAVEGLRG